MKLNGWMRLWIVLSACWLVLAGYFAYNELSLIYTKKTYESAKDGIGKVQFIFSSAQSEVEVNEQFT